MIQDCLFGNSKDYNYKQVIFVFFVLVLYLEGVMVFMI